MTDYVFQRSEEHTATFIVTDVASEEEARELLAEDEDAYLMNQEFYTGLSDFKVVDVIE